MSLFPKAYVNSTYEIPYETLYQKGYRGIIFDIDNTLVPHNAPATKEAVALFYKLHQAGYKTLIISNNKEPRVKAFANTVNSSYIYKANKPSPKNYLAACKIMNTTVKDTFFVGDQIFTDIWGANRAGINSILVKPINPKEEIQIVLKRIIEKPILFIYRHKKEKWRL